MFDIEATNDAGGGLVSERPRQAKRRRAARAAAYHRRLNAGICTWRSAADCRAPLRDGSSMCEPHAATQSAYEKRSKKRERAELRSNGFCIEGCGNKTNHWRCAPCAIRLGYALPLIEPGSGVGKDIVKGAPKRREQIAARTTAVYEPGGDGYNGGTRNRFRGRPRKGMPSRRETDEWDLRAIRRELERGEATLAEWHAPETQALPRIQRDAVLRDALAHLELVQRFLDELVDRGKRRIR